MKTSLLSITTFTWSLVLRGLLVLLLLALAVPAARAHWPNTNVTKFVQLPNMSSVAVEASGPIWLADDFLCTNTGPVMDIHIWGSWLYDQVADVTFTLSIWSDVPANPPLNYYSHPGAMLWSDTFDWLEYEVLPAGSIPQEPFYYPDGGLRGYDNQVWQYNFYLSAANPFTQTGSISAPLVYWLAVSAASQPYTYSYFGWKTSTSHFNDYAVYNSTPVGPPVGPWQQVMPPMLDLAFAITTSNSCPAPTITCTNRTVQCGAWSPIPPTAWDNCGNSNLIPVLVSAVTNGACPWTVTLVWKATDYLARTNMCNQAVTVIDTNPPVMNCVGNKTVQCNTTWSFDTPTASDTCCANVAVTVVSTVTNGSCPWNITRTWSATDCCTNSATCTQMVTVVDTVLPVVVCPGPLDYSADTNCNVTLPDLRGLVAVTNCTSYTMTQTPPSGTILELGSTNVTFAVVDVCGNSNGCVATVQVRDTLPPVATWPATTLRLVTDTNCSAVLLPNLLANVQTSDCSPPVTLAQTPAAGTVLSIGMHPVTLTAVDQVHNTNTCVVSVSVVPPVPLITQQPNCVIARLGDSATFTVSAQNCTNFYFQWSHNGQDIPNATNSYYYIPGVGVADVGNYVAAVFNTGGTAYTVRASLRLGDPLQPLIRNYTPTAWKGYDVYWSCDTSPHNKIDDLIDASSDSFFDVIVNFSRCVEPADMQMLAQIGNTNRVVTQSKYLSTVLMAGLTKAEIANLALQPGIAFIEKQMNLTGTLNRSVPSLCVIGGASVGDCAGNVQDTWGYDGTGVGIVIMDSGVANQTHDCFKHNRNVNGYDTVIAVNKENDRYRDPADGTFHGTSVADIALGLQTTNVPRGVATNATLIDVKVIDDNDNCYGSNVLKALEVVYDNRVKWGVDIINMSFYTTNYSSDGKDSLSQLVDLGESMGIVMVVAAGNNGPNNVGLRPPACATRAITVGATDDKGTITRADDSIAEFDEWGSAWGPRTTPPGLNDLKPEVVAPGADSSRSSPEYPGILCAWPDWNDDWGWWAGTSQAAPHVSGVAALIIQAERTIGQEINPASIKQLLIQTAVQVTNCPATYPNLDAIWNKASGWGSVNAYAAIVALGVTDVRFPHYNYAPHYACPDVTLTPDPQVGQKSTVNATIKNQGAANASNVRVHLRVHDLNASIPTYYEVGTVVTDLAANEEKTVHLDWTPTTNTHQCVEGEIAYGSDTDFSNNKVHHNYYVAKSPVYFQVQNILTDEPALIQFSTQFENPASGWTVQIYPTAVTLGASQCPVTVEALMIPPSGAPPGLTNRVHITAMIGTTELGGLTIEASTKIILSPIQRNPDGSLTFSWTTSGRPGEGTLEWAGDVTGPWTPVPGSPTSPYTFSPTEPQMFYRVRNP
jgi:hypothetical protein